MAIVFKLKWSGIAALAGWVSVAVAMAVPAAAQAPESKTVHGLFQPPEGCAVFMTVQSRGCRVSNHYRCDGQPPGDQWRADFDQEGIFFLSRTDYESQWIESYDYFPTVHQTLDPDPADPASFSTLLSTGRDDFDFNLTEDTGNQSHVTGHDLLTGNRVTIDGIELQETEFQFTEAAPDGTVIRSAHGNEYIHPEWRVFFSGPSEWDDGNGGLSVDGSPKEFIFPGEPGFQSTQPIFDCDVVTSSLPKALESPRLVPVEFGK